MIAALVSCRGANQVNKFMLAVAAILASTTIGVAAGTQKRHIDS